MRVGRSIRWIDVHRIEFCEDAVLVLEERGIGGFIVDADEVEDSDPCAGPDQDDRDGFVYDVDIDLYMLIDGSEDIFTATTDRIVQSAERMRKLHAVHLHQSHALATSGKGDGRGDTRTSVQANSNH